MRDDRPLPRRALKNPCRRPAHQLAPQTARAREETKGPVRSSFLFRSETRPGVAASERTDSAHVRVKNTKERSAPRTGWGSNALSLLLPMF